MAGLIYINVIFYLVVLIFGGLSCTNQTNSKANITFNFQSKNNSSLGSLKIDTVIVNISAPDLPLQSFDFECDNGYDCNNLNFEVTSGNSRLIQLLVITEEVGNPISKVNYGDVTVNLGGGDNHLSIDVTEKGSFFNEAKILGRYIPSSGPMLGQKLTGVVDMKVAVENGKPDMRVGSFEIFSGWFNTFAIDGIPFKFVFNGFNHEGTVYNNQAFFHDLHDSAGLVLGSAGLAADGNRVNHFRSSKSFYEVKEGKYILKSFRNKIVGFFGQNPDSLKLCAKKIDNNYAFDRSHGDRELCKVSDGKDCLAFYQWKDIEVFPAGSLANGSSDSCVAGNTSQRKVNLEKVGEDDDQFMGYVGPFTMPLIDTNTLGDIVRFDPTTGEIKWQLILGSYLAGVDVFYAPPGSIINEDLYRGNNDQLFCEKLPSIGFTHLGFSGGTQGQITTDPTFMSNPGFHLILCPKKHRGGYYRTAYQFRGHYTGDNSPVRVHIAKHSHIDGFTGIMHADTCYPIEVSLKDSKNDDAKANSSINVNITSSLSSGRFFESALTCDSSAGTAGLSISIMDKKLVYFRHNEIGGTFNLKATNLNLVQGEIFFQAEQKAAPDEFRLVSAFDRGREFEAANTEECVSFNIAAFRNNELVAFPESSSVNFSLAKDQMNNQSRLASNDTCSGYLAGDAIANLSSLNDRSALRPVYFDPSSTNVPQPPVKTIMNDCYDGTTYRTCSNRDLNIVAPNLSGKNLKVFHVSGNLDPGQCQKFKVGYFDDHKPNPYPLTFGASGIINLTDMGSTKGVFHNSSCTSPPESDPTKKTIGVSGSGYPDHFYYRPSEDGEMKIQGDYSDGISNDIVTSSPVNIEQASSRALISVIGGPKISKTGIGSFSMTFTNVGDALATSLNMTLNSNTEFIFLGGFYPGTGGGCGTSLAPGVPCTVEMDYSSISGPDYDSLKVTYDDGLQTDVILIVLEGNI